jgi:hypothetical protein
MRYPYVFMHEKCGRPAFLYAEYPGNQTPVDGAKSLLLDGTRPGQPVPAIICGSCGLPVLREELRRYNMIKRAWLRLDLADGLPPDDDYPE